MMSEAASRRTPVNVAGYLELRAREQPDDLAVAVAAGRGYRRLTFAQLNAACDRFAWALQEQGVHPGARVVLMVPPSPEFFALTFALFKLEAIPVLVDPGMGIGNLGQCLAEAEPEAFIGVARAQLARRLFGWARDSLTWVFSIGAPPLGARRLDRLAARSEPTRFEFDDAEPDQLAAILFTSGSTGPPKGAIYNHGMFAAQVRALQSIYGIEPGERDLSTFPLFALFGPALGMASVVPDMDASRPANADPRKLLAAFEDFQCTNLFASPALIDKLGRYCSAHPTVLATLRRAISAGAPASAQSLARFVRSLPPGAEVFTPYGATESLPVSSIGTAEILTETAALTAAGGGVCVGRPASGVDVCIIRILDQPVASMTTELQLSPGEIGEIAVRGDVVSPSYFARPDLTALAKIEDRGSFWHRMGDVGYLDDLGRLWMCGRKAHRVQVGDETLFTVPCEAPFNGHEAVFRSALVGVEKDGATVPVLCVELESGHWRHRRRVRRELLEIAASHSHTRHIATVLFHRGFPVDVRHNAKIFREKLASWASARLR